MIYGDPIILGGAGSGGPSVSDAILLVTAPAGSTVTATKGGVTLTPTIWVSAADPTLETALFVIGPGQFDDTAWTIEARSGADTATDTVVINSAAQYVRALSYATYIFRAGYGELIPLTTEKDGNNATIEIGTGAITIVKVVDSNSRVVIKTGLLDLAAYSTLYLTFNLTSRYSYGPDFGITSNDATTGTQNWVAHAGTITDITSGTRTMSVDISAYNGSYYVVYWGSGSCVIYDWWLEE